MASCETSYSGPDVVPTKRQIEGSSEILVLVEALVNSQRLHKRREMRCRQALFGDIRTNEPTQDVIYRCSRDLTNGRMIFGLHSLVGHSAF